MEAFCVITSCATDLTRITLHPAPSLPAPFISSCSIVSLGAKSAPELKQLLNDVLAKISSEQAADLTIEAPEVTNARMLEFLRVLRYKPRCDGVAFRQGMARGDPEVVYPLLEWAAPQVEALRERAYVARYMVDVEVPDDFALDPELVAVQNDIMAARQEFAQLHKGVKTMRAEPRTKEDIAARIATLEEDREQLVNKLERTRPKVENLENFAALREAAAALRGAQDEDAALRDSIAEHRNALEVAEAKVARGAKRLKELRALGGSAAALDPAALVAALAEEVTANRASATEDLPRRVSELRAKLSSLEEVLAGPPVSELELATLQRELGDANGRLNEAMAAKAARRRAPEEGVLRQQANMAGMVAKKKAAVSQKLARLETERMSLRDQLGAAGAQQAQMQSDAAGGDGVAMYVARVRERGAAFKAARAELDALRTESGVLAFTEAAVSERESAVREEVGAMERAAGVQGFTDAANKLNEVSQAKAGVDQQKGAALEELSKIIAEIQASIKERKAALAPRIKDLRSVRSEFQELDAEHAQRKLRYDEEARVHEGARAKVAADVARLRDEVGRDESRYHYLGALSGVLEADVRRMGEERQRGSGAAAGVEALRRELAAREDVERRTRDAHGRAQQGAGSGTAQREMIAALTRLCQVKLEASHQAGRGGAGSGAVSMGMGGGGYSGMGGNDGGVGALSALEDAEVTLGGAERLVL